MASQVNNVKRVEASVSAIHEQSRLNNMQVEYQPADKFVITAFLFRASPSSSPSDAASDGSEMHENDGGKPIEKEGKETDQRGSAGWSGKDGPMTGGNATSFNGFQAATPKFQSKGEFSILRHLLENGKRQQALQDLGGLAKPCVEYLRTQFGGTSVYANGCPYRQQVAENRANWERSFQMDLNNVHRQHGRHRMHPYLNLGTNLYANDKAFVFVDSEDTTSSCSSSSSVGSSSDDQEFEIDVVSDDFCPSQQEPLNLSGH